MSRYSHRWLYDTIVEKKNAQLQNKVGQQDIKIGAGYESWVKNYQKKANFLQENKWAETIGGKDPEGENLNRSTRPQRERTRGNGRVANKGRRKEEKKKETRKKKEERMEGRGAKTFYLFLIWRRYILQFLEATQRDTGQKCKITDVVILR